MAAEREQGTTEEPADESAPTLGAAPTGPAPPSAPAATDATASTRPHASRLSVIARLVALTVAIVLVTYVLLGAWAVLGLRRYPGWVSAPATPASGAMNVLLIGTDAAAGQPGRADTLVILHLPADRSALYLISVPRVLQASLRQGVVQLKTARLVGGVPLTVQAVEQVTGLTMNHVVETDFDGFAGLSDVVGGVTVNNPKASTADGGLVLPAGEITVEGQTALTFVRDHNVTDEVRNERQRAVLKAVVAKLPAALANPVNLGRLSTEFLSHVSADEGILGDLTNLLGGVVSGRTRVVSIATPVLPETHYWGRPRIDPNGMALLAAAMRDGKMATYRPDHP